MKRAQKSGYNLLRHYTGPGIKDLLEKAAARLFGRLRNPAHCLYPILPSINKSHVLLPIKRGHIFAIRTVLNITCIKLLSFVVFLSSYINCLFCGSHYLLCFTYISSCALLTFDE